MNKIPCTSQNTEAKTLPADVCVFGHFERLPPAAVYSADCWFDSRVKWLILVSSIVTYLRKNSFLLCWNSCKQRSKSLMPCCFWSTVSKRGTHFEHIFLIDKCSCEMVNTLPFDTFKSSAISRNFNLRSAKTSLWNVFGVFWDNCQIWAIWAFSIIWVCMTYQPLFPKEQSPTKTYQALLEQCFPYQKAMFYQHTKFRDFHCFENLQQYVKLATVVDGDLRAPFSIATTPRCRGRRYSFSRIAPLYPWSVPYNA